MITNWLATKRHGGFRLFPAYHYFGHGVKSCWLVIPALKNIYVFSGRETYQISKSNETLTDASIGVTLPLSEIFK